MRKKLLFFAILLTAGAVYAQSTATQAVLGSLTTSGCPGGGGEHISTPCFVQYSASNPLPVTVVSR